MNPKRRATTGAFRLCVFLVVVSTSGCYRHSSQIYDRLVDVPRKPPDTLLAKDYDILSLVLNDICQQRGKHNVWLYSSTLSFEDLRKCDSTDLKMFFADRFEIDSTSFRRLAHKVPLDIGRFGLSGIDIAQTNDPEIRREGLMVATTLPVFSSKGRAFVYAIVSGDGNGGHLFYSLERKEEVWVIARSVTLTIM